MKSTNKGADTPAESVERRTVPEGNPGGQSTRQTQDWESVSQAAERIRQFVQREPGKRLTTLLHHVTVDALRWAFFALKRNAAVGVDGLTWREYAQGLEGRLADLHDRVHSGAYRATPSRRVHIPKPDGGTRPLGVAALEDKIVQKAVAETILTPIYESEFLGFSYGFRPGRGAHNALDAAAVGIERRRTEWLVDADIRGFFDNVSRAWLVRFLEYRIGDKRVIRLIIKWLNAGVMDDGEWRDEMRGTPQGSVVSPILANIYLHYVLDLWFQKKWRTHEAEGETIIVRYADDFVVGFQYQADAERFLADLKERLARFELTLHPDKTRLIEFGAFAALPLFVMSLYLVWVLILIGAICARTLSLIPWDDEPDGVPVVVKCAKVLVLLHRAHLDGTAVTDTDILGAVPMTRTERSRVFDVLQEGCWLRPTQSKAWTLGRSLLSVTLWELFLRLPDGVREGNVGGDGLIETRFRAFLAEGAVHLGLTLAEVASTTSVAREEDAPARN